MMLQDRHFQKTRNRLIDPTNKLEHNSGVECSNFTDMKLCPNANRCKLKIYQM